MPELLEPLQYIGFSDGESSFWHKVHGQGDLQTFHTTKVAIVGNLLLMPIQMALNAALSCASWP